MKVFVDSEGVLQNIGPWDPAVEKPEGLREMDADVEFSDSGRAFLASDYYNLRKCAYPDIGDQLDALFKAGLFPDEMAAKIQAVKDRYPKPE